MKLIPLILAAFSSLALYGEESPSSNYRIDVQVEYGNDTNTCQEVASYLKRELRALSDVTVTTNDPDYVLQIMPIKTHPTGTETGYALSLLFSQHCHIEQMDDSFPSLSHADQMEMHSLFGGVNQLLIHSLRVCDSESLQKTLGNMVIAIDTGILEPARRRTLAAKARSINAIITQAAANINTNRGFTWLDETNRPAIAKP